MYDRKKKKQKKIWMRILIAVVVAAITAGVGVGAYYGTRTPSATAASAGYTAPAYYSRSKPAPKDLPAPIVTAQAQTTETITSNATLRATENSSVPVFVQADDGTFSAAADTFLADGTRVKIEGKFDAGQKYTAVSYKTETGVAHVYVLTSQIDRDGGVIEIIAISLIIVTLAIGVIVFLLRKKSRL